MVVVVTLAMNGFAAKFNFVAIPDSQYLAASYPAVMEAQVQWIVDNVSASNIAFVTHLGDIVDVGSDTDQWDNATDALDLLDGAVPYSVCAGNHDYHDITARTAGAAEYVARFGPSRYSGYSWYKGSHRNLNHYQIFSADGREWLHINLDFMSDSENLLWAQRVLDDHSDLPAILSTHAFLNADGELSGGPGYANWGEVSNGGEAMWEQFVKQNDQIFLVLNGHFIGQAHTNISNVFGRDVSVMFVDHTNGDDAYIRILEFDSANDAINATTYDPYADDYLTDATNRFTLSMDFSTRLANFSERQTFSTIQAANITVVQNDTDNTNGSVTVSISDGTADFSVVPAGTVDYAEHDNGDYYVQIGSRMDDDLLGGVLLASIAENGRVNLGGSSNSYHVAQAAAGPHGNYKISVASTSQPGVAGGEEHDVNVSAAYFPFAQGWKAGRIETYNEGTTNWALIASEGLEIGNELIQVPQGTLTGDDTNLLQKVGSGSWPTVDSDRGIWDLEIPGVDSTRDGILLVCAGRNDDNFAAASPKLDGSGWKIHQQDGGSGNSTESDHLNFVYVPYSTTNIVAGRGNSSGDITSGTEGFTLTTNGHGSVILDIAGYAPTDGTLIVSTENEYVSADDFTTYEAALTNWVIETRDLPDSNLTYGYDHNQFAFLFIPHGAAVPGPGQSYRAIWTGASGDWMTQGNWLDTEALQTWGIPGYVIGNPLNTGSSTDVDWNLSQAYIQSGIANVTPGSNPDGRVAALEVGVGTDSATLNIGTGFSVEGNTYMGRGSVAGTVCTINQTAGDVVLGTTNGAGHRVYLGLGDGSSAYNLSGGTLHLPADWSFVGYTGKSVLNVTGGATVSTPGDSYQFTIGRYAGSTGIANIVDGSSLDLSGYPYVVIGSFAGAYGELNLTNGTVSLGGGFYLSDAPGSTGIVNMASGTFAHSDDKVTVGESGYGEFNQAGGDVDMRYLTIGDEIGGEGIYNISGGTLDVDYPSNCWTVVGSKGYGEMNIDGGTVWQNASGGIYIGNIAGSTGVVNISTGTLETGYKLVVGGDYGSGEFNQSGGTVIAEYLSLGHKTNSLARARGVYNMSGGTLELVHEKWLVVGATGDGEFNQTGGDVRAYKTYIADHPGSTGEYRISGGTLVSTNYLSGESGGRFTVSGSGATKIQTELMYFYNDILRVELDGGGSTLIMCTKDAGGLNDKTFSDLRYADLEVATLSGFFAAPGRVFDVLWVELSGGGGSYDGQIRVDFGLAGELNLIDESAIADFTWRVVSKSVGGRAGQMLQLVCASSSVTSAYAAWVDGYDLTGSDAAATNDYDLDGLNNLYEYGLGGDPTNELDQGYSTSSEIDGAWMYYVYPKRTGPGIVGLDYYLEITDNLIIGPWTDSGYEVTGSNTAFATDFHAISNRVSTAVKDQQFIRLTIEEE